MAQLVSPWIQNFLLNLRYLGQSCSENFFCILSKFTDRPNINNSHSANVVLTDKKLNIRARLTKKAIEAFEASYEDYDLFQKRGAIISLIDYKMATDKWEIEEPVLVVDHFELIGGEGTTITGKIAWCLDVPEIYKHFLILTKNLPLNEHLIDLKNFKPFALKKHNYNHSRSFCNDLHSNDGFLDSSGWNARWIEDFHMVSKHMLSNMSFEILPSIQSIFDNGNSQAVKINDDQGSEDLQLGTLAPSETASNIQNQEIGNHFSCSEQMELKNVHTSFDGQRAFVQETIDVKPCMEDFLNEMNSSPNLDCGQNKKRKNLSSFEDVQRKRMLYNKRSFIEKPSLPDLVNNEKRDIVSHSQHQSTGQVHVKTEPILKPVINNLFLEGLNKWKQLISNSSKP